MNSSRSSVEELLSLYGEAARAHGAATEKGDYKTANRRHDSLLTIFRELSSRGPEARSALLGLLKDPDPATRLWAAVHTLEIAPEASEAVLEALTHETAGFLRVSATTTLAEWRKGTLVIPT